MQPFCDRISKFCAVRRNFFLLLAFLAAAAVALTLVTTRWGAGLSDDSYFYVKPARDILAGRAPFFSSHYPPLLPLLVTLVSLPGIEPLFAIRLFNAVCFGVSLILAAQLIWRMTSWRTVALAGALVFLSSQTLLEVHSWAMSEALFICMCFATVLAFSEYYRVRRTRWLVATAMLAGCAALSRYAGISLIGAVGLALLILPHTPWKKRLQQALIYGAISGALLAAYVLGYSLALNEWSTYNGIHFVMLGGSEIREAFYNLLLWLIPGRLARGREILVMGAVLGLALVLVAAYALIKRDAFRTNWKAVRGQPLFALLALLILANLFLLYQAHISPSYRSPFDTRLLSPNLALLIVLVASLLGLVWKENGWVLKLGILTAFIWILFLYVPRSIEYVGYMREHGAGFATPYWAELDAAKFIKTHPVDSMVTTAPYAVYFATGEEILGVGMSPDQLRAYLKEQNRYLVVFNSMPLDMYGYPTEAFLQGLVKVYEYCDCDIYQVKE